jgi:hypothetical protein
MLNLIDWPLGLIFATSLVVILTASEIGRRHGIRVRARGGDSVSTLEGALLGLLSLLIGFTFSVALARFEVRRDALLEDANSIGTTALRARLLPQPYSTESLRLLREYAQLRLDINRRAISSSLSPTRAQAVAQSNAIHEALWQQAKAVTAKDSGMVPAGLFIQTLNQMIDANERRLATLYNHVPLIVLWVLYGVTVISIMLSGYACGLEARRSGLPVYIMGIVVATIILLIQDLDRAGAGFIDVNQQPMLDVAASLKNLSD